MTAPAAAAQARTGGWRLGPSHPDYGYSGELGYPVLARDTTPVQTTPRAARATTGKVGPIMPRRFFLTARGVALVSRAELTAETCVTSPQHRVPSADAAPSGVCAVCSRAITVDPRLLAVAPQRTCSLACAEKAAGRAG